MFSSIRTAAWIGGCAALIALAAPSSGSAQSTQYIQRANAQPMTTTEASRVTSSTTEPAAPSRLVTAVVTDAVNGEPIPHAHVEVDGVRTNVRSNRDGKFFVRDLKPGTHVIRLRAIGYTPRTITVTVPDTGRQTVAIDGWLNRAFD